METYRFRKLIHRLPGKVIHAVPLPKPEISEGFGVRKNIGEICKKCGYKQVMLVTDRTLLSLGYEKMVVESLDIAGIGVTVFGDIDSEPTLGIIEQGRSLATLNRAECIIALGGGSVMDSCKMIAAAVRYPRLSISSLLLKLLPVWGGTLPIIMVPTTAGTGAEITVAAVVNNAKGVKSSTVLIGLNVTHVVHDIELTIHAPRMMTTACAVDALSHCIEGAVSDVDAAEKDMKMSLEGIKQILTNLPKVINGPSDNDARLAMCRAAMYGGNAINTQLAGYVHAFAHSIGAKYHMSHGQAISLMLLPVLEFQKDSCRGRYAAIARYCGLSGSEDADDEATESFLTALRQLMKICGMDNITSPIRACDHGQLIKMVVADSINYSAPVTMSNKDIKRILEKLTIEQ